MPSLKHRLADTDNLLTFYMCTIPSPVVTQAIAASGVDSVIIDMEHGAIDHAQAHAMIAATQGTGCAPLVRIPETTDANVKRVLDLGAEGIMFPLISNAEDARNAVAAMTYPPEGRRGFGPFLAQSRWNTDIFGYLSGAARELTCCILAETAEAVENIDEICAVPGIDIIVPAQFDLSTSLGIPGQFDHPDFIDATQRIEQAAKDAGIPLGGVAFTQEQASILIAKGYRGFTQFDVLTLRSAAGQLNSWCKP
ncbi:MAG: hypothetical protein LJE68_14050 [Rhodobacter sp.]|nr:hypothetical protein [Rhodobacter sp.]